MSRNWQDPADYAFTQGLNGAQWAWEFLRRNPDYQREYAAFRSTWDELETAYGHPPHRDFTAWKQDPRAYAIADDGGGSDCRVDRDKVLIECHLGARWGFYKFPVDPSVDDPVGEGLLTWRPLPQGVELVGPEDQVWLGDDSSRVALGFDLSQSLRDQLEDARRLLAVLRRQRLKQGLMRPRTVTDCCEDWTLYLRLLDADAEGASPTRLGSHIGLDEKTLATADAEAFALLKGGYRLIAGLPGH